LNPSSNKRLLQLLVSLLPTLLIKATAIISEGQRSLLLLYQENWCRAGLCNYLPFYQLRNSGMPGLSILNACNLIALGCFIVTLTGNLAVALRNNFSLLKAAVSF